MTQALTDHVWRRLGFVLRPYSDRMQRVSVRVVDENGPRGGADKFCSIHVHLIGAPVALTEDVGPDLFDAIDRAADRIGGVVGRHLDSTRPARGAERVGTRPARQRREFRELTRAHEDIE